MKRIKIVVLMLFILLLGGLSLTACTAYVQANTEGTKKFILYFNGGEAESEPFGTYFVEEGARVPTPKTSGQGGVITRQPTRRGYDFVGWYQINFSDYLSEVRTKYRIITDDHGREISREVIMRNGKPATETVYYIRGFDFTNPDKDESNLTMRDVEEGSPVFASLEPWNFDFDKVTDDTVLVAIWNAKRSYIYLPDEFTRAQLNELGLEGINTRGLSNIKFFDFNNDGSITDFRGDMTTLLPSKVNYQIEGLYFDKQCINPIPFINSRYYPDDEVVLDEITGEPQPFIVYVKWIEERYILVNNREKLMSGGEYKLGVKWLNTSSLRPYYFQADIDLEGAELVVDENFNTTIQGRGYSIRNFTIVKTQNIVENIGSRNHYAYGGIFDNLVNAEIRDLSFEGFSIRFERANIDNHTSLSYKRQHVMYLFAKEIRNSTVVNVTLDQWAGYDTVESTITDVTPSGFYDAQVYSKDSDYPGQILYRTIEGTAKYGLPNTPENDSLLLRDDFGQLVILTQSLRVSNDAYYSKTFIDYDLPVGCAPLLVLQMTGNLNEVHASDEVISDGSVIEDLVVRNIKIGQNPTVSQNIMINRDNYEAALSAPDVTVPESIFTFDGWYDLWGNKLDLDNPNSIPEELTEYMPVYRRPSI